MDLSTGFKEKSYDSTVPSADKTSVLASTSVLLA